MPPSSDSGLTPRIMPITTTAIRPKPPLNRPPPIGMPPTAAAAAEPAATESAAFAAAILDVAALVAIHLHGSVSVR